MCFREKPAATDLSDLARLEHQIHQSGIQYSIMLDMRTLPIFRAAWIGNGNPS